MTHTKALKRLVEFGPAALQPFIKTPRACLLATAAGCKALNGIGIAAEPMSVHVVIANRICLDGMRQAAATGEKPDFDALKELGAWMVDAGHPDFDTTGTWSEEGWYGHLMIWLPTRNEMLDLTMGQMARPAKQIYCPSAMLFPFTPPSEEYDLPSGAQAAVTWKPDDRTFVGAKDWEKKDRHVDIAAAFTHVMQKGRLP